MPPGRWQERRPGKHPIPQDAKILHHAQSLRAQFPLHTDTHWVVGRWGCTVPVPSLPMPANATQDPALTANHPKRSLCLSALQLSHSLKQCSIRLWFNTWLTHTAAASSLHSFRSGSLSAFGRAAGDPKEGWGRDQAGPLPGPPQHLQFTGGSSDSNVPGSQSHSRMAKLKSEYHLH